MKRITLFLLVSFVLLTAPARAIVTEGAVVGQPTPDFTLKDLNGKTHSLKDHRGQIAVIVFVSTECPFSNAYLERLRAIASDYSKKNVTLLGVNANPAESLAQIREHARKNKLDFTILKDEGSRVADAYGATRTPEVFVADQSGVLRYRGRIDNSKEIARVQRHDLRLALDEMIAGKPVSVAETKSFGCPIKMVRKNAAASGGQQSNSEEPVFVQAGYSPGFANSFVPQKKPAPKTAGAKKPATRTAVPNVALLKPEDFNKFKDAAQGKVLVINFWATWCGPCVAEFPEFVALDRKYRAKGVKVVGISADEVTDIKRKVIPFIRRQKVRFDIVVQDTDDPQQMIDAVYKEWAGELPATFIYDKQGNLSYKHLGIINRDVLVAEIEKALK